MWGKVIDWGCVWIRDRNVSPWRKWLVNIESIKLKKKNKGVENTNLLLYKNEKRDIRSLDYLFIQNSSECLKTSRCINFLMQSVLYPGRITNSFYLINVTLNMCQLGSYKQRQVWDKTQYHSFDFWVWLTISGLYLWNDNNNWIERAS